MSGRARWIAIVLSLPLTTCGAKTGLTETACDADAGQCCTAKVEECNGLDDDCDGVADDGLSCFFLDGQPISPVPSLGCGASWYRYDFPDTQSANPTPDIRRSGRVVAAVQAGAGCAGAHLAVIADLPDDGSGGQLDARFSIVPAGAAGLVLGDEPGECSYDAASGIGQCTWVWQPCCTDGVLLGELTTDACIRVELGGAVGVSNLLVLDGSTGQVPLAFPAKFEICSQIRPEVP